MNWKTYILEGKRYVKEKPLRAVIALALIMGIFLAGSWQGQRKAAMTNPLDRKILYYVDPMNPAHTSPEPGLAPCGMKMEPVYAQGDDQSLSVSLPAGTIKVSPEKQQIIGVRLDQVAKAPYTHMLRTLGKVTADENRIYVFISKGTGWVRETYGGTTGSVVQKDEALAAIYSPEFFSTQQAYVFALRSMERAQASGIEVQDYEKQNLKIYRENLKNLGVSELQIKELANSRQLSNDIILRAPSTSLIIARNVSKGQQFERGAEWYRLVDLAQVWIQADLYKNEARFVKAGEKVRVSSPYQDGTLQATVSQVLPTFDPATQTMKFRLEAANPGYLLRPGMFVDLEFPINLPPAVTVPVEALLDAGRKQTVFVDRGNGYFEPRKVETGWRLGDRVEITKGLKPGEKIVISGNFLLDSESRMKLAAAGMYGEVSRDPVCGLDVQESQAKAAGHQSSYQNETYYFCSENCQQHFNKCPERYTVKPGGSQEAGEAGQGSEPGKAPILAVPTKTPEALPSQTTIDHGEMSPPDETPVTPPAAIPAAPAGPTPAMAPPGTPPVAPPVLPPDEAQAALPPTPIPVAPPRLPSVSTPEAPPGLAPVQPELPQTAAPQPPPALSPHEVIPPPRQVPVAPRGRPRPLQPPAAQPPAAQAQPQAPGTASGSPVCPPEHGGLQDD